MNYRFLEKQKTLSFGRWPDLSLADARAKRDAARNLLAKDTDPAEQAKQEKIAAQVAAAKVHHVPLSCQVLKLLSNIEHDDALSRYLFPSLRSLDRPMSENTINAALRRLGYSK